MLQEHAEPREQVERSVRLHRLEGVYAEHAEIAEHDAADELAEHRRLPEADGDVPRELRRHENERQMKCDRGDGIARATARERDRRKGDEHRRKERNLPCPSPRHASSNQRGEAAKAA